MRTRNLKYIIVKAAGGAEIAIIFPEVLNHCDVAKGHTVVSAGFFGLDNDDVGRPVAYLTGGSDSLNLESRVEDAELILVSLFPALSDYGDLGPELQRKFVVLPRRKGLTYYDG